MMRAFSLARRVALVTGGGRGIGAAIAQVFAQAGARVLIANRTAAAGEAVAQALREQGHEALAMGCDVGQRDEIEAAVAETVRGFGGLDIVVHNAAVNPWAPPGMDQVEREPAPRVADPHPVLAQARLALGV